MIMDVLPLDVFLHEVRPSAELQISSIVEPGVDVKGIKHMHPENANENV